MTDDLWTGIVIGVAIGCVSLGSAVLIIVKLLG